MCRQFVQCMGRCVLPTPPPRSRNFMQPPHMLRSWVVISWAPIGLKRGYASTLFTMSDMGLRTPLARSPVRKGRTRNG